MSTFLQLTLDLLDAVSAPLAAATPVAAGPRAGKAGPAAARPHAPEDVPENALATPPAQALQQTQLLPAFRHPQASREALLAGVLVAYEFRRGKRRTIGFSVGPQGLVVSAPKWVPLYEIDKAVQEKSAWILKKLKETRERHQRLESARIDWKDGAIFRFLGRPVTVVLDPQHVLGRAGAELRSSSHGASPASAGAEDWRLHLGLPHHALPEQIRDAVQVWLVRQAKRIFTERMNHFTPKVGVKWRKLSLSNAGTRWGSASADGSIRLNWRLIHLRQAVIDYVVVHELSHLHVMDHSPRFWNVVKKVMPDYAELRTQLKAESIPDW